MVHENQLIINIVTQMEAGGAQKAAIQMCEKLIEKGYRSEVWFLYLKRPTYISKPYVRWLSDRQPKTILDAFKILYNLRQLLSKEKPLGVITYTHYANIFGQFASWSTGVRHRLATQRNPVSSYPFIAQIFDKLFGLTGIYSSIIFVSNSVKDSFSKHSSQYLRRSRMILNGLESPQPTLDKSNAREKFGLPQKSFIIGNVGRLAMQKNQILLINAIKELPQKDIVLAIAGDGELRESLSKAIQQNSLSDKVLLLGEITPSDIPDFLSSIDAFVFPSNFEAFGFALVEAMMLGLPIIASDIPAHREVLGNSGILLPKSDSKIWANQISTLAEDKNLQKNLGTQSKEKSKDFEVRKMIDGYLETLIQRSL